MALPKEVKGFILENYKGKFNREIADMVNQKFGLEVTSTQIKSFKRWNKLNSGIGSCKFPKGHLPFNKGKHWEDYMSKESQENCKKTCFTKDKNINNQRHTWRELGETRVTKDGYIEVKTGQNKWELLNRLVYKMNQGRIPDNCNIIFADKNNRNFNEENLICVKNDELLELNRLGLIYNDIGATKCGVTIAKLNIKINELKKE